MPVKTDEKPNEETQPVDAPVSKTSRSTPTETSKQDKPEPVVDENANPKFYVWLANGEIVLVDEEDVPTQSGTNAEFGHWQRGDKVHTVVGVYPAEIIVKG